MRAFRTRRGTLLVPVRAETDDGIVGDGMVEVGPEDPRYDDWELYAEEIVEGTTPGGTPPPET